MGRTPPGRAEFYTQIRERNAKRWGTDRLRIVQAFGRDLRATVRDMILELVQNAEDARAQNLGFRLYDQGLLVWNNGICFSDKDVESISGLLISTKDARSIGHFGIGFKSVLLVTRTPYVLSGSHVFRLEQALDPYPVDSEDELPSEAWGLFQAGKTVFWLPCTGTSSAYEISRAFEQDLTELLLFMRSLKEICWESQTARTVYTSVSQVVFQEEGEESQEIHIRRQQDGDREHICTQWLRLDWQIAIPDPVIQDIVARLQSEEDVEGAQRWEKLSPDARRQMFSLAIALEGGKPRPLEGRAFARLPTGYRTGLKFHVSGRFATTVDRDRLRKDDPLTQWALAETERMLSQMPERLKRSGWFTPPMWAIFPVQKDDQSLFAQAVDTLRKTLSEGVYFHGDDKKLHPKTDVYLAHSRDLYGLLNVSALQEVTGNPNARWIHYELCEGETREVARSLGVPSVESHHVLRWLQSKEAAWFEARPDKWLEQLYRYLASHEELRSGAKELPVVRLHTHRCVRPSEALLPTKQLPEALEPYKRYLPVVDSSLIQDEKTAEALRRLGVKEFDTDLALRHFLQATYGGESKPSVEENREHIRMLFALWKQGELPPRALQNWSSLPILRTRAGTYVAPNQAYLPAGLGGLKEVEEYFHLAGIDRFVAEDYANPEESKDQWREFLEKLGVVHLPRSGAYQCELESWEVDEWIGERELFKKNGKDKIKTVPQTARRFRALMTEFEGFEYTFEKVREENGLDTVRALYLTIEKLLEKIHDLDSDLLEYYSRGQWYSLYVYPAIWLSDLQTVPWLPADNGSRSIPNRLFHPDLQPILGPGFSYVHEKVGIRQGSKLARLLGIRQEASTEDVLKYLADLSAERGDNAEIVKPIYEWLSKRPSQETPLIRQRFQGSPLILIPGRGWFRTNEICWRDPTGTVPEAVEDWPDLKAFFCHTLQIPENPHPDLLARTLLGWAEREPRPDLPRIQKLASALCEQWDKLSAEVQNRLKSEECWPARVGDEIRWERASHISHIYLRDREHIASLFGNALPWWALDGLENLAEKIGVPKVSTARQEIRPIGSPQPDPMLTARLKYIWPFVVRFAQPSKLPDAAPQVQRVAEIEVRYHVGGRSSRPDKVESHLDLDQWCLYLSEKTEQRLAHHIGDALKRALEVPHLREFLKDIWDQIESTAYLKEILISWERERDVCLRDLLATFSERGRSPEAPSLVQPEREAECSLLIAPSPVPIASDLAQPHKVAREREGEKEGHLQYWTAVPTAVQPPKDRESPQKDQIEKDAMLEAIQWWLKRGYEVGDVSDRTRRGYDLEVTKEGITYCVEVKGTAREERISITEHEWHTAEEKGEQYYLHVVTIPERESYLIQSPAHMLESEANPRERTVTQVYYEIPFSAITRLAKRE